MVDVDVENLDRYLNVPEDKLKSKGIDSVRSRVGNLKDYLPEITVDEMKEQIKEFKELRDTIHYGNQYRLISPYDTKDSAFHPISNCVSYVSDDKSKCVTFHVTILGRANPGEKRLKFRGLDENAVYIEKSTGKKYGGDLLMNIGLLVLDKKDYESQLIILEKC